ENARSAEHHTRTEPIDQISVERHQPGLRDNEYREGPLDRVAAPVEFLVDGNDERRPTELKIGHHHHADDPEDELPPTRSAGCGQWDVHCGRCCHGRPLAVSSENRSCAFRTWPDLPGRSSACALPKAGASRVASPSFIAG